MNNAGSENGSLTSRGCTSQVTPYPCSFAKREPAAAPHGARQKRPRRERPTILSNDFMPAQAVSHIRTIHAAAEPTAPSALCRRVARTVETRAPIPAGRHLCAQRLYRHHARDQGPRHLLQAERLHVHPPTLQAPRLCGRNRGRALDRQGFSRRAFLRPDLRLLAWRHAGERSMVRSRAARRNIRHAGARDRADRAHLVQSLRSTAASLRRRGYRASDTQAARADRLAASPRLHGPALGSAAGPPSQFPLGLPERARPRAALAHGRAARPPRAAARPAAPAREDMPRSNILADRLRAGG